MKSIHTVIPDIYDVMKSKDYSGDLSGTPIKDIHQSQLKVRCTLHSYKGMC